MYRSKYLVITKEYLLPVLVTLGSVLTLYLVFFSPLFRIRQLTCVLDYAPCPESSLTVELNNYLGHNLFRLDSQALAALFVGSDSTIRQVEVSKRLPGELTVNFYSVYPSVAVRLESDPRFLVFDEQLRLIGVREQDPNVPVLLLATASTFQLGKRVEDELVAPLEAVQALATSLPGVVRYEYQTHLTLTLDSGITVLLDPAANPSVTVSRLQAVLKDHTIMQEVSIIDLRFAQVVVK